MWEKILHKLCQDRVERIANIHRISLIIAVLITASCMCNKIMTSLKRQIPAGSLYIAFQGSVAADSCCEVDDQNDVVEETGHLMSLGPECSDGWAVTESTSFILDPDDQSSPRGYTHVHWFS